MRGCGEVAVRVGAGRVDWGLWMFGLRIGNAPKVRIGLWAETTVVTCLRRATIWCGLVALTAFLTSLPANSQEAATESPVCLARDGWRYVSLLKNYTTSDEVTIQLRRNSPELTETLGLHLVDGWQEEWIVKSGEKGWVATLRVKDVDLFSLLRIKGWRDYNRGSGAFSFDGQENGMFTGMDMTGLLVKNGLAISYDWFDETISDPPSEIMISDNCGNLVDTFNYSPFLLDSVWDKGGSVFNQVSDTIWHLSRREAGWTCTWVLEGCGVD